MAAPRAGIHPSREVPHDTRDRSASGPRNETPARSRNTGGSVMHPIATIDTRPWRRAVVLLTALLLSSGRHRADAGTDVWMVIGLEGRAITGLAVDPGAGSTLYASTDQDLFKTTDAGGSWAPAGPGTRAVAIAPSSPPTVYTAGTGGVFRTTDGGATWIRTSLTNPRVGVPSVDPL